MLDGVSQLLKVTFGFHRCARTYTHIGTHEAHICIYVRAQGNHFTSAEHARAG